MLLFQTDGCPRDGCRFDWHDHGCCVHMDASWMPLDDQKTTTQRPAANPLPDWREGP